MIGVAVELDGFGFVSAYVALAHERDAELSTLDGALACNLGSRDLPVSVIR